MYLAEEFVKRIFSVVVLFSAVFVSVHFCAGGHALRVAVPRKWMRAARNTVKAMTARVPRRAVGKRGKT